VETRTGGDNGKIAHSLSKNLSIKFALWNAQSIRNKLDPVHDYMHEHNLDLMMFTECWLKDDDIAAIGQLENYGEFKLINKLRGSRRGGGIGCLYKSNIIINKLETPVTKTFEHLALNLKNSGRFITILIIYRPEPTCTNKYTLSEFFDEFTELVSLYHCRDQELLIVGDFNFHFNKPNQPNVKKFHDILDMFQLTQHINTPTHKAGNILDLVITRENSNLLKSCVVDELLSDHHVILMEADLQKSIPTRKTVKFRKTILTWQSSKKILINIYLS
jgi:exonuclease III